MYPMCNSRFADTRVKVEARSHRVGDAGGRGGRAHHDDPVLIVVVGGDRGDGGVIDQGVGVVGAGRIGTAVAQGGLSDDQHAARRLQHDHLPHPRRRHPVADPSTTQVARDRALLSRLLLLLSTLSGVVLQHDTFQPTLKAPTRSLSPAPPARTQTGRY